MYKRIALSILFLLFNTAFSGQMAQDFRRYQNDIAQLKEKMLDEARHLDIKKRIPQFTENPKETAYYAEVDKEKQDLTQESLTQLPKEQAAQTMMNQSGQRNVEINQSHEAVQQIKKIQTDSQAIVQGEVACEEKPAHCEIKTHEEYCTQSKPLPSQTCVSQREVHVKKDAINQHADFTVWVNKGFSGLIFVNLVTGAMVNAVGGTLSTPLSFPNGCNHIGIQIHGISNNNVPAFWVDVIGLPTCQTPVVTLAINKSFRRIYPIQVKVTATGLSNPYVAAESWTKGCDTLEKNTLCTIKESSCTDTSNPKIIEGISLNRDCWEKRSTFQCRAYQADECQAQKSKNCLQTTSTCIKKEAEQCLLYQQTYQCQEKVCTQAIPCFKPFFCQGGDCSPTTPKINDNFGQAVSQLAVVGELGKNFDSKQENPRFFEGKVMQCTINPVTEFADCCSDKGWGTKIHLAHCSDEEKALGQAKKNYLIHYLGEYCSERVFGTCVTRKKSYCVFENKMARLVQEGHLQQLNSAFLGTAENPTCGGLAIDNIQDIDFEKIEFVTPHYPFPDGSPNQQAGIASDMKLDSLSLASSLSVVSERIKQEMEKMK